ncbi:pentatricopeptide repeat-containing protein [Pyrus ussuriensis x Pyrus communis]|uniref:Pentatricopeptide repeat-containing protein n=1 Tax=Pyrus ussuriensis x Pyrus communis TaxID=2448454 RepID=A0A5N5I1S5_9ROSA|nr:pentatricopeptide repeat-containing protein [Pyrus ussuriensis x Pyrus communis]
MGIREWRNSRSQSIRLGHNYDMPSNYNKSQPGWQKFWKRFKIERKKIFGSSTVMPQAQASYDPDTYSKNFDQGTQWMEPDNLPRSFSARFADPSRVLHGNRNLLD